MEKFTKMKNVQNVQKEKEKNVVVYDGYLKVINNNGWEFVCEKDNVLCLVYFIDEGYILMRTEPVAPWYYRYNINQKTPNRFLTLISGTIENNETPQQTLRRELYEEAGIILSEFYEFDIEGPFFHTKGSTAQYYTCLLPLTYNDFRIVMAPGDGSAHEKMSKTIRVSVGDIDDIKINDIVSQYLILKLKNEYKIGL